jgi:hypothetical protein
MVYDLFEHVRQSPEGTSHRRLRPTKTRCAARNPRGEDVALRASAWLAGRIKRYAAAFDFICLDSCIPGK